MDIEKIKSIDIVDWMLKHGYKQGKGRSGKWRSFYSPFGSESNASFKIDVSSNKWVDYSAGVTRKQSIIDLVMMLPPNPSFTDACKILSNDTTIETRHFEPKKNVSGVKIHDKRQITDKELLGYMTDMRKINYDVLVKYCVECDFSFPLGKNPNAIYTGVAFKNSLGGYEIRNTFQKIATSPKAHTNIKGAVDNNEILLFEAFVDFMSYLTHNNIVVPPKNTIVLNGLGMINVVKPFLEGKKVYLYLDLDAPADRCIETIDNCDIVDMRTVCFPFYSDYNEMLKDMY